MSARRFLRLTHGWIGVVLAFFIVLVAGSGASLAFMSEMFEAQYGEVMVANPPAPGAAYTDIDRMIATAQAERGSRFTPVGVLMPHSRVPKASTAMVFGMEEGGDPEYPMMVSVDPYTAAHKGSFSLADAFGHDMIDFHYELVFGEWGATFVSILGLLLAVFALTGLWLWWPRGGGLWRKARRPQLHGKARDKLFQLHGWIGIWTALLVVLFGVSGTAVGREAWFGPLLVSEEAHEPTGGAWSRTCAGRVTPGEAARIAQARFPDKRVTTLYFVSNEPIHVYLRWSGDSNAIEGSSVVWVHPTCQGLVHAIDRSEIGGALGAQNMMFSLHGGYWFGPVLGPILVLITGLSLVFFSVSGVIVFFLRTWRPKKKVSVPIAEPVAAE
jgi:uncharacterized iron-regulated membrane protein